MAWTDPQVHLVSRCLPGARTGKGDALNSAYAALNEWLALRRLVQVTGAAAAAGGLVLAAALPAAAASPNRAYASSALGLVGQSPLGEATFPGTSPVTIANASITALLTTGAATATSGPTSSSEVVHNISGILSVLARLTASSVTSSCSFNTNTGLVTGTAGITNGQVTRPGSPATTLASNPSPNTKITIAGLATITLNRQTKAADGTLTVTAIFVSLLGSTQRLSLGVSVCNAASLASVPILPGVALPGTLGGLVLLLAAAAAYQLSRRRRLATVR